MSKTTLARKSLRRWRFKSTYIGQQKPEDYDNALEAARPGRELVPEGDHADLTPSLATVPERNGEGYVKSWRSRNP